LGTPLPVGHPTIDGYLCRRAKWSAGLSLSVVMATMFWSAAFIRLGAKWHGRRQLNKSKTVNGRIAADLSVTPVTPSSPEVKGDVSGAKYHAAPLPPPPPPPSSPPPPPPRPRPSVGFGLSVSVVPIVGRHGRAPSTFVRPASGLSSDIPDDSATFAPVNKDESRLSVVGRIPKARPTRPPPPPPRDLTVHRSKALNQQHRQNILGDDDDHKREATPLVLPPSGLIVVPDAASKAASTDDESSIELSNGEFRSKQVTLMSRIAFLLRMYRIPRTDISLSNVLFFLTYLAINLICVFTSTNGYG
jgi:hypothetical protein